MSSTPAKCRIVVLISGSGSNLQAIIDAASADNAPFEISAVFSNRPNVEGLTRAANAGIDHVTLDHKLYPSRQAFDEVLAKTINGYQPDIVVLAGFMRILSPEFVIEFKGRLINIHPSLLPKYPGLHTHQRALDAGDSYAGCTVHFVSEELDGGPAIIQAKTAISQCKTAADVNAAVLPLEHQIYPVAVEWLANKRVKLQHNSCYLDGKQLASSGYLFN